MCIDCYAVCAAIRPGLVRCAIIPRRKIIFI